MDAARSLERRRLHRIDVKLYAISDIHVSHEANRRALAGIEPHPEDWLIVAGDVGETRDELAFTMELLTERFAKVLWTPGNHELWTLPLDRPNLRGQAKYDMLVELCRRHGVVTPEDPYPVWPGDGVRCVIAPLFVLYDYSFRPDDVPEGRALAWAEEAGLVCTDEQLLHPDPYSSRPAWCRARVELSERRLAAIDPTYATVLINHFPLRRDLAILPAIPRFSIWCGTRKTEDWHTRFRALAVVSGHLHIRSTQRRDGVRFEEVSLGYPRHYRAERGIESYLREILPGSAA